MAEVVVIGAGLSGTLMAYELLPQLRKDDRLTVVSQGPVYHFVPSNPWVAIGWRKRGDIEIDLWAIADGQILIGEAKIQDRLENTAHLETSRCNAFNRLALDLTADQFVMATARNAWRTETRDVAERIIGARTPIRWMGSVGT